MRHVDIISPPAVPASRRPTSAPRVAVVGAGVAGLSAARTLAARGFAVQVFDRGRRPGGRCSTRRTSLGSFDHGAQYFTARDARFIAEIARLRRAGHVAPWPGRVVALEAGAVTGIAPCVRHVAVPTMDAFVEQLAAGQAIHQQTKVAAAHPDERGWLLVAASGAELGRFDGLVLALPPEQALPLVPRRLALREMLRTLASAPCWALLLAFDARLPLAYDGAFVTDAALRWIARDSAKPARGAGERWVAHANPAWSAARLHFDADTVAAQLVDAFWRTTALAPRRPVYRAAHRWALARPDAESPGTPCEPQLALAACGDWCHGGRIEGAWLSGLEAGEAVAGALRGTVPGRFGARV